MARQKFLGYGEIGIGRSGFAVSALEQRFGGGHKEDVVVDGKTLRGEGASEEGPQERI